MSRARARVKYFLDGHFPNGMRLFRQWRAQRAAREFRPTVYGFDLAAPPLYVSPEWEKEEISRVLTLLPECDLFIDVGANVGFYTVLAAKAGKHVVAFEPLQNNLLSLYGNVERHNLVDVEVLPIGLSVSAGTRKMYNTASMGSFVRGWGRVADGFSETVSVSTLDLVMGARIRGKRCLIKVDVEGHELEVLQGASAVIANEPAPVWLVENFHCSRSHPDGRNPNFRRVFDLFWAAGYEAKLVGSSDVPITASDLNRSVEFNYEARGSNYLFSRKS